MITIVFDGDREWVASIGPSDGTGLTASGRSAASALLHLADRIDIDGWCFDPSWKPGKMTYHDA